MGQPTHQWTGFWPKKRRFLFVFGPFWLVFEHFKWLLVTLSAELTSLTYATCKLGQLGHYIYRWKGLWP